MLGICICYATKTKTRKTSLLSTGLRARDPVGSVDNSPPAPAEQPQGATEEARKPFIWAPYVPKADRPPQAAPMSASELAAKYGPPQASPQLAAILAAKRSR
jgi:hypothetical protein